MRMLVLWLLLLFAIAVRETARALAAAWFGLELRGILLLLAGLILSSAPGVNLLARPWIAPAHLLRSLIWVNIVLGLINLIPALPLDGGRAFAVGASDSKRSTDPVSGAAAHAARLWGFGGGFSRWIAIGLIVSGLVLANLWLALLGAFVLIGAHMEGQGMLVQSDVETVRMRDVMLTQFSTLSASDTLEDALQRAVHTLQDVFPVVRGGTLVGSVSRQNILEALAAEGNSYVQGVMTRSFQTAQPDDSLVKTLRRILGDQGAQMVPVMDGERIVGIVTPQNLSQSMGLLSQTRRMRRVDS
jgi:CBS domain-containing protein